MNYNWFEFEGRPWRQRYPEEVAGYGDWIALSEFEFGSEEWISRARELFLSGKLMRAPRPPGKSTQRNTVFISHRQCDVDLARQAADALRNRSNNPVDVWLDVEDPILTAFGQYSGPAITVEMFVTALVIEMALLNSTHVLALFTANTQGSLWVPYEFGRVKSKRIRSSEAASLNIGAAQRPEYMLLGPRLSSISDLDQWP